MTTTKKKFKGITCIRIELAKNHDLPWSNNYLLRIGDLSGTTSLSNIGKKQLLEELKEQIKELDKR